MAQDVTLMGASYSDVPAVVLPKTGGGDATFTDVSDTTAAASDVASGKYFYTAAGVKMQGTASGGGGSSRVVAGTFTGTNAQKGTAVEISLPYTGSGYPVALMIFPSDGAYCAGGDYYDLVQRYAIALFSAVKHEIENAPSYSGASTNDFMTSMYWYKSSATNSTSYTGGQTKNTALLTQTAPSATAQLVANMRAKDKLRVFIADTSYGFAANIEYTYVIYYSS